MLGLEISSDFMLCLGIVCILSGVMFFYFKRNLTLLENAQMEQAKLLQSVIMSMQNLPSNNLVMQGTESQNDLIDVSDDSDSDSDSDSDIDSDDEIEDVEPVQYIDDYNRDSKEVEEEEEEEEEEEALQLNGDIDESENLIQNIKVVEMKNLGIDEESLDIEEDTLDPSLSDDLSTLNSESIQDLAGGSLVSLKSLKVGDLRKMVLDKGLHDKPKTLKKSELITLLNE
jgi:hypothetical protein